MRSWREQSGMITTKARRHGEKVFTLQRQQSKEDLAFHKWTLIITNQYDAPAEAEQRTRLGLSVRSLASQWG